MFICLLTSSTHTTLNGVVMIATIVPYRRSVLKSWRNFVGAVTFRRERHIAPSLQDTTVTTNATAWRTYG